MEFVLSAKETGNKEGSFAEATGHVKRVTVVVSTSSRLKIQSLKLRGNRVGKH